MSPKQKQGNGWKTRRRVALASLLAVVLLVIVASLALAQVISITTTYGAGNSFSGNMFDVEATYAVMIHSFDIHTSSTGPETVHVYYKAGTYKGHETMSSSWTPMGTDTVTGAGIGNPTAVDIGGLIIPAGEIYGLYVTLESDQILYTNGVSTYSDANVTLDLGAGLGPHFTSLVPSRTWNGTIYYERTNTSPVANDDYGVNYNTDEETAFTTGNALDNDTDLDGDILTIIDVDDSGLAGALSPNDNGTFGYDTNGQFEYLGDADLTTDVFTYTISDGKDGTDWATVTITVTGINDPPVAVDDEGVGFTTDEDTAFVTFNVLANDTDPEDDDLNLTAYDASGIVGLLTPVGDGTFRYDPHGQFEYLGDADLATDVFTYTVSDGVLTDTATVTLTINGINDPPVAVDDEGDGYDTDEDSAITTGNVLVNDTDPEDDVLSVDSIDTTATQGAVTDLLDGTFTYDPDGQFEVLGDGDETIDTFMYIVSDGALTDTATVTITIAGINDAPVAVDDEGTGFETDEDTAWTTDNVLNNDYDAEMDALSVVDMDDSGTVGLVANQSNGTFYYDPDGQFEYLADGETYTDTYTYTISDGVLTDTATVSITIAGINAPPVAENDDYVTAFEIPKTVAAPGVLDNDTDVDDSDTLTAVLDSNPDGDLDLKAGGSFVYTPTTGFKGADTFTYHAFDGLAASNVATVTINVLDPTDTDLKMEKVVDVDTPVEADTIVYTLTVTNNGPAAATGIQITDTLPSGITYVADDGGGDYDGTTWAAGDLGVDASAMLHITVTVDAETTGTTITNTAVISASDQEDPVDGNDEAQALITVVLPQADLEMSKDVNNQTPDENGSIVYTLLVTNNGPRDATGVEISDTLPSGVTYVSDDGGGDYAGSTWDVGDLDATDSATLHITVTVDAGTAGTTITNTAVISALDQLDPDADNDEADVTIAVKIGPSVIAVSPEPEATDVPLDEVIVVTFNRPINSETFTYTVSPDPGGWSLDWSSDSMTVTLSHADFEFWTEYTVSVTGAQDMAGNPLEEPYVWSFESEPIRMFLPLTLKRWAHPSRRR